MQLITHFKALGLSVMGGVPTYWRQLKADAKTDPAWRDVYAAFDILSPWSVGRYGDDAGADAFKTSLILPDLTATRAAGIEYMPVIFPGFSWRNLLAGPLNQIPRRGGRFYWRQGYNAIDAGCTTIFVAMFDEVDEGTAIYKLTARKADLPVPGEFVSLDADGESLRSDWYLRLTGELTRMLRGALPMTSRIPIQP